MSLRAEASAAQVLFKMLNQGVFNSINGCISTGKEANVYHATTVASGHLAVKVCATAARACLCADAENLRCWPQVYKTSILVFKDRDRYVTGDWRFRNGYCRHNPRKMVRTWAEKEMRNLARLHDAGIFAPQPRMLRAHVLVMDFIGEAGYPAPRLKVREPANRPRRPAFSVAARPRHDRTRTFRSASFGSCTRSSSKTCALCSRCAAWFTQT